MTNGAARFGAAIGARIPVVVLAAYCISSLGTLIWITVSSLKANSEFISTSPWSLPAHASGSAYGRAWDNGGFGDFFVTSTVVTFVSVTSALAVSALAAYVLGRVRFPGNKIAEFIVFSGLLVPSFVIVIPVYFLLRSLGILGSIEGLILVYIALQIPFDVFVLTPFFRTLPHELEEAAYLDGAGPYRTFVSVMLPLALPGLVSVGLLQAIGIWNEYFYAFILLSNGGATTLPLGLARLSQAADFRAQWVELLAGVIVTMGPVLVVFAAFHDRITESLTVGAVKS